MSYFCRQVERTLHTMRYWEQKKKKCYPSDICVSDHSAEVGLQSLVDKTITRFFMIPNQELSAFLADNDDVNELQYIIKWGCDGCGGLSRYKQKGSDPENPTQVF